MLRLAYLNFILAVSTFLTIPLAAQAEEKNDLGAQIESVADVVANDIKPLVTELKRPITVFNYYHNTPAIVAITPFQRIDELVKKTWAQYNSMRGIIGYVSGNGQIAHSIPGFYAALNPIETADFGGKGSDWALLSVEMPVGFRILFTGLMMNKFENLELTPPLGPDAINALDTFSCGHSLVKIFNMPDSAICAHIAAWVLNKLDIDAIMYPFGDHGVCPKQLASAMLFTSSARLHNAKMTVMSSASEADRALTPELNIYQGLFNYLLKDVQNDPNGNGSLIKSRPWRSTQPISDADARQWIHDHLFGCGDTDDRTRSDRNLVDSY